MALDDLKETSRRRGDKIKLLVNTLVFSDRNKSACHRYKIIRGKFPWKDHPDFFRALLTLRRTLDFLNCGLLKHCAMKPIACVIVTPITDIVFTQAKNDARYYWMSLNPENMTSSQHDSFCAVPSFRLLWIDFHDKKFVMMKKWLS